MKISEVKEMYHGQYTDYEVYVDKWQHQYGFHTDRVDCIDDYSDSDEAIEYDLMDKEDYSNSILANTCTSWEDYGYKDSDKILVIKVAGRK